MDGTTSQSHQKKSHFGPSRSTVLNAAKSRKSAKYNIWYQFGPKINKDVVPRSDAEFLHFLWMEADTNVVRYVLEPDPVIVAIEGDMHKTQFDALAYLRSGRPQLREVKAGDVEPAADDIRARHQEEAQRIAADKLGFDYARIGMSELQAHTQLINNSLRMIPYIAAARELSLHSYANEVSFAVQRDEGNTTIERILDGTDPGQQSMYLAALFVQIQTIPYANDLDKNPLTLRTKVWIEGESP